jgi:DNA-directed RNA polymerase subunit beta'
MIPILADIGGSIRFEDIVEEQTMREETDRNTGIVRKVIIAHKGDLHPQIIIEDRSGKILGLYPIPERAHIEVDEGQEVTPGALLAKTPREITGTQDITGGLPRVTELFEARKPKDPSVISEIDGVIELGEKRRGKRTIIVRNEESGMEVEHLVPHGKHLRVHRGDHVKAGEPLVEGPLVLQDVLRVSGEEHLENYILREVQSVYRLQNQTIDDKHVEIITSQMLRKVRVDDPGDTDFLPGSVVDRFRLRRANQRAEAEHRKPASFRPLLLGLTKASLQSESFLAAASFQETTKVLTEASLAGKVDHLQGLKENIIMGHLIPAGTGFRLHQALRLKKLLPMEETRREPAAGAEIETAVATEDEDLVVETAGDPQENQEEKG